MSALADLGTALWKHFLGATEVDQAVTVITAVTTGIHETATGAAPNVLASIARHSPDVLKLIEDVAKQAAIFVGGPLAGAGVDVAIDLLAMNHTMDPDEEKQWFDRQTSEH